MILNTTSTFFERHAKLTLLGVVLIISLFVLFSVEYLSKKLLGLGKTVIYNAHPIYGYRPLPNQEVARQAHHLIRINNLGLRAESDWELSTFQNKVLFLGDSVTYGGSYISNQALFSYLALKEIPDFISGNAGVNGWGVNNVHAFVKEMAFLPAQIYVSVFPEGDFYRGLQRIGGQPFWTRKPHFALEELFQYIIYTLNLKKMPPSSYEEEDKIKIAEIAVKNLKDLDHYLKANQRDHLIYITPTQLQVQGMQAKDEIIKTLLEKYDLNVIYLKDRVDLLLPDEKKQLFHDNIHLSTKGHEVWAKLISTDIHPIIKRTNDEPQNT